MRLRSRSAAFVMAAIAMIALVATVRAMPVATLMGPTQVTAFQTNSWNCRIQYNAYLNYGTFYNLHYYFTYEQGYWSVPQKVVEGGPITTTSYNSGTDPNIGYSAYISQGSTTVWMWPGGFVTHSQTSDTYGIQQGNAWINCTTGTGHQVDDSHWFLVDVQ